MLKSYKLFLEKLQFLVSALHVSVTVFFQNLINHGWGYLRIHLVNIKPLRANPLKWLHTLKKFVSCCWRVFYYYHYCYQKFSLFFGFLQSFRRVSTNHLRQQEGILILFLFLFSELYFVKLLLRLVRSL